MKKRSGFSLVELLVVIAIIGILAVLTVNSGRKAVYQAKSLASNEAMRQRGIDRMAEKQAVVKHSRSECRKAYRQVINTGKQDGIFTELLYVVRDEEEFLAYWYTLINPEATAPLEFDGDTLIARGPDDKKHRLRPVEDESAFQGRVKFPYMWEFLSTDMSQMSTGNLGIYVLYNTGETEYMKYPGDYPCTAVVARASNAYAKAFPADE